jgi:hypothetical protein
LLLSVPIGRLPNRQELHRAWGRPMDGAFDQQTTAVAPVILGWLEGLGRRRGVRWVRGRDVRRPQVLRPTAAT